MKTLTFYCPLYEYNFFIYLGGKKKDAYVHFKKESKLDDDADFENSDGADAVFFSGLTPDGTDLGTSDTAIWLSDDVINDIKSIDFITILSHEIGHAVSAVMRSRGVVFSTENHDTEEQYEYYRQYIFRTILKLVYDTKDFLKKKT